MIPSDEIEQYPRPRFRRFFLLPVAIVIAGAALFAVLQPAEEAADPQEAPEFSLPLLEGGTLSSADLEGKPVVLNLWASWCGPCRSELPFFSRQALERGDRIAFLGSNTNDSPGPARRFLDEVPLPFPSYSDPNGDVAQVFKGTVAFPTTAFYGSDGRLVTVKQGAYTSERELAADIDRYAR